MKKTLELANPEHYINREISQLELIKRVLAQAKDISLPLLERLKFLAICSSILDEFFEIRVAGIKRHIAIDSGHIGPDGLTPLETLQSVNTIAHEIVAEQYDILNHDILPALKKKQVYFLEPKSWNKEQAEWVRNHFRKQVAPVISPIGLDFAHPFPQIMNKSLNFIYSLEGKDAFGRDSGLAIIHVPRSLPRVVKLPKTLQRGDAFILLSSVIQAFSAELFPGMRVTGCYQFRVTRNSDLSVEEEDVDDLAHALKGELFSRQFGDVARLEVSHDCQPKIVQFLQRKFKVHENDIYYVKGPVNFNRLLGIYSLVESTELKFEPLPEKITQRKLTSPDVFERIRKDDILLHHPYDAFNEVLDFVHQAAADPNVLAIRQTLYRTGPNSVMVRALIDAARAGKEVTAVIELRARFDEEDNISLAKNLQEAGALVVYGVHRFKTHAKMTLVVRREQHKLRRYVHLGTGNYHTGTAKQYCDFSLLTCDPYIAEDVNKVFQQLTGMGVGYELRRLLQSPFTLHTSLLQYIDRETRAAEAGQPAKIMAKLNSLSEPQIIQALYKASQAGVKIDLIIRGICCLRPGISGLSENINVISIIGRFLEHSRVYYFENNGNPLIYCASADWMHRNFFNRVEIAVPIKSTRLAKRIMKEAFIWPLKDNQQSWQLQPDGEYVLKPSHGNPKFCVQENLLNRVKSVNN